jgi:hypothetical protein
MPSASRTLAHGVPFFGHVASARFRDDPSGSSSDGGLRRAPPGRTSVGTTYGISRPSRVQPRPTSLSSVASYIAAIPSSIVDWWFGANVATPSGVPSL